MVKFWNWIKLTLSDFASGDEDVDALASKGVVFITYSVSSRDSLRLNSGALWGW